MKAVCQQTLFFKNWRINLPGVNAPLDVRGHSCPNLKVWHSCFQKATWPWVVKSHFHLGHSSLGLKYNPLMNLPYQVLIRRPNMKIFVRNSSKFVIMLNSYQHINVFFCLLKKGTLTTSLLWHIWTVWPGCVFQEPELGILCNPTKLL